MHYLNCIFYSGLKKVFAYSRITNIKFTWFRTWKKSLGTTNNFFSVYIQNFLEYSWLKVSDVNGNFFFSNLALFLAFSYFLSWLRTLKFQKGENSILLWLTKRALFSRLLQRWSMSSIYILAVLKTKKEIVWSWEKTKKEKNSFELRASLPAKDCSKLLSYGLFPRPQSGLWA